MWPHRRQPTRLPRLWDSPGKNTGVGCHFLLQCMKVKSESEVAQSYPTFSDPMDFSPPGSSIHGIFQARVLEWGAIAFSSFSVYFSVKWRDQNTTYHQFSSVTQSCLALYNPMDCSMPGLPVHHHLPEFTQTHVHWVSDAIQPSHPLLSLSTPALNLPQHQGLFKWVSSSYQVARHWSFSFSISPSNEHTGLIASMLEGDVKLIL